MPCILAIDSSTDACSVAITTTSGIQQKLSVVPREHTQRLLPMVESLLAEHQLALSQCDAIAYGAGPGSFTGLRIGLSVAQGLAYGADIPLVPVSTLKAMAQTAVRLQVVSDGDCIIPVIDARMDEVYWSAYTVVDQQLNTLTEDSMSHPEQAAILTQEQDFDVDQGIKGVGSGWRYDVLQKRATDGYTEDFYPQAHDVATLALGEYATGNTVSPLEATPVYLRNEISWQKRQRIRN